MNLYKKYILPRLIDSAMRKNICKQERPHIGQASGVVLEIGFGSGLNLPFYKNITKLFALDPSKELYNIANSQIKSFNFPVEYIQSSAEKIPLEDKTIDCVVSTWSFCSIPNAQIALMEIARVLKTNGKFIFIEHGESTNKNIAALQKCLTPVWSAIAGGCHLNREIDIIIKEAGFEILKMEKRKASLLIFMYKGIAIIK